ncbi:MAG: iron ABC transporter permease [Muribaculaceae bacterium]|nr:iron ABC transporter permease [Muribaculaceae bacterium]
MNSRHRLFFIIAGVAFVVLAIADIAAGSVAVPMRDVVAALTGGDVDPVTRTIVVDFRLLKAVVAIAAGAALSAAGLEMQTLFRNPLAGPYVLGISSGASLGVAILLLGASMFPALHAAGSSLGIAGAAWIGAATILAIVTTLGHRVKDIMVILIIGMMISSAIGAVVQILQYAGNEESLKNFVIWTMGSLGEVTRSQLWILLAAVVIGLAMALIASKQLNLLLLGEEYALTMGLNLRQSRLLILLSTTLLAGTVTAFCGPIGFIGLAVSHLSRALIADSDHRALMPATILTGSTVMLACDLVSKMFVLPINAITSLVGIPVVIAVVLKRR